MTVKDLKDLIVECLKESDIPVGGSIARIKLKGFSQSTPDLQLQSHLDSITQKYDSVLHINAVAYKDHIELKELNATKDAPVGTGSSYMTELANLADSKQLQIKLVLAKKDYGAFDRKKTSSVARLKKFYERFGFKDKSGIMVREPKRLNELNSKRDNYVYYGFTKNQEDDIYEKVLKYLRLPDSLEKERIKNEFEALYQHLVGRNPVLKDIDVYRPNYKGKLTARMDLVFGAISGIPPEHIKDYIEVAEGKPDTLPKGSYTLNKGYFQLIKS